MKKIVKRSEAVNHILYPDWVPPLVAKIMQSRGIIDAEKFLHPIEAPLYDPALLPGVNEAVKRLCAAKQNNETVCVWGDYDVDGVSATALMLGFFKEWGLNAIEHIPSRHNDGYGLNKNALQELAGKANILLTVDNGISEKENVEYAKELGMTVIVTDHHTPGDRIPDCIVINPQIGNYPWKYLCGTGVAFKLASAIDPEIAAKYLDLVALATVADVVLLQDENRQLVARGIRQMQNDPKPGIKALCDAAGVDHKKVTSENIAFILAPRLNAGGRMGDAIRSMKLLRAESIEVATPLATELEKENQNRKKTENQIIHEAEKLLESEKLYEKRIITLYGEWNKGVIGLAASRILEEFYYPVILFSNDNGILTGSCRSIEGVDIYAALTACSQHLTRYGGHKQAAGLTIGLEKYPVFMRDINQYIKETCSDEIYVQRIEYDIDVDIDELSVESIKALQLLEPTGFGNPSPLFRSKAMVYEAKAVGSDGSHLKLSLRGNAKFADGIWFRHGGMAQRYHDQLVDVVYAPQINEYKNMEKVSCNVTEMAVSGAQEKLSINDINRNVFISERLESVGLHDKRPKNAPLSMHKWISLLTASPSGTLLVASGIEGAMTALQTIAKENVSDRVDIFNGTWPTDAKGFNALCILPKGMPPEGYKRIVLFDSPSALWQDVPVKTEIFEVAGIKRADWIYDMPDVAQLRTLYSALRKLFAAKIVFRDAHLLIRRLNKDNGLPAASILAGLQILQHMKLIDYTFEPFKIVMRPMFKSDPQVDDCFMTFCKLKEV